MSEFVPALSAAFVDWAKGYHDAVKWGFERGLLSLRNDAGSESYNFVRAHFRDAVQDKFSAAGPDTPKVDA